MGANCCSCFNFKFKEFLKSFKEYHLHANSAEYVSSFERRFKDLKSPLSASQRIQTLSVINAYLSDGESDPMQKSHFWTSFFSRYFLVDDIYPETIQSIFETAFKEVDSFNHDIGGRDEQSLHQALVIHVCNSICLSLNEPINEDEQNVLVQLNTRTFRNELRGEEKNQSYILLISECQKLLEKRGYMVMSDTSDSLK